MEEAVKLMFNKIIEDYRQKAYHGYDEPTTLVSLLLSTEENGQQIPDAERVFPTADMIGECFSLFAAGSDTTANTLG